MILKKGEPHHGHTADTIDQNIHPYNLYTNRKLRTHFINATEINALPNGPSSH